MKKFIFFFAAICCAHCCLGQLNKASYQTSNVTWFGIDYTKIVLIGEEGFADKPKIVSYYFNIWNSMVNIEPDKYDIPFYLLKENIKIDLKLVNEKNVLVDPNTLIGDEQIKFGNAEIEKILGQYDFDNYDGFGALLIAEYYDKRHLDASYVLVLFDVKTKQILNSKRYMSSPEGFGFRNYWARTFYNTLKAIKFDMKVWLKK